MNSITILLIDILCFLLIIILSYHIGNYIKDFIYNHSSNSVEYTEENEYSESGSKMYDVDQFMKRIENIKLSMNSDKDGLFDLPIKDEDTGVEIPEE